MNTLAVFLIVLLMQVWPVSALAQSESQRFEAGVHVSSATSGQFEETDVGIGGRFTWYALRSVGLESELTFYPGEFPEGRPFSRGRIEGLFGVTVGPRIDRVRPFVHVRSGFLNVRESSQPFACILIYPPPLSCTLAAGRTLPAFNLGGGVDVRAGERLVVRIDAGDRLLKYPGPVFDEDRNIRNESFFSHDLRLAAGVAFRF